MEVDVVTRWVSLHLAFCSGGESLTAGDVNSRGKEDTINAIYAYAVALSNLIQDACPDGGICDALYAVTSEQWLDQLREVSFQSPVGLRKMVTFDENGDGAPAYSIYQLKEVDGEYDYEEVCG